jgi:hypothetical protein
VASYLETGHYRLTIEEGQYDGKWKVTKENGTQIPTPSLGGLYIADQQLSWTEEQNAPSSTTGSFLQKFLRPTINRIARLQMDDDAFLDLYEKWKSDTLTLTRGITGTHMAWNDLVGGSLGSEGGTDEPTFTMGNANPTRWLPTSFFRFDEHAVAILPAIQDLNHQTTRQALENFGGWIPTGAIVKINAGASKNFAICWLNAGEIVVRGPLSYSAHDFLYWRIIYSRLTEPPEDRLVVPPQANLLPLLQQRPFRPENPESIMNWIGNSVMPFHAEVEAESGVNLNNPVDAP